VPRVLLSFAGYHDPFAEGAVSGAQEEGPLLRLVRMHPVDMVVLFSNPETADHADATQKAIEERHPTVDVEVRHIALDDPTNYLKILTALRAEFQEISKSIGRAEYFVGAASGTPQMHASWVLLAASGEIPARILQVRPPRYVTEEMPPITEVFLGSREFPTIRSKIWADVELAEEQEKDPAVVIERLGIVGDHPAMVRAIETAGLLAPSDVPVLIEGESGTGKEKIANLIHQLSDRAGRAFIPVNCAAIPGQLAESVLFGHKKGAFTGATEAHDGKFLAADNGTLFLDEVAELSPEVQAKLLRTAQDGVIEALGSKRGVKVNVRLIAATNCDLKAAVSDGKFRDDLYYRLTVGKVDLPPLRERRSDIPKLALYFLDEINLRLRKRRRFAPEALVALQAHEWEGNVRELQNVVHRSALLCRAVEMGADNLQLLADDAGHSRNGLPEPCEGFSLDGHLKDTRRRLFDRALELAEGNQSQAARLLGVTPQAVFKFVKESE